VSIEHLYSADSPFLYFGMSMSQDISFPAQTVHAFASLTTVALNNGSVSGGIIQYRTKVDGVEGVYTDDGAHGLAPAIFTSDVDEVTFLLVTTGSSIGVWNAQVFGYG
jgi:hypothetical protein